MDEDKEDMLFFVDGKAYNLSKKTRRRDIIDTELV